MRRAYGAQTTPPIPKSEVANDGISKRDDQSRRDQKVGGEARRASRLRTRHRRNVADCFGDRDENLDEVSWGKFFKKFDESKVKFIYSPEPNSGFDKSVNQQFRVGCSLSAFRQRSLVIIGQLCGPLTTSDLRRRTGYFTPTTAGFSSSGSSTCQTFSSTISVPFAFGCTPSP